MKEHTKTPRTDANQDWVCYNCNNLNYSFRKICNRCKATTREDNKPSYTQLHYYQMYYHPSYYSNPAALTPGNVGLEDAAASKRKEADERQNRKTDFELQNDKMAKKDEKMEKDSIHVDQECLKMLFDKNWLNLNYESEVCLSKSDGESQQTSGEEWSEDDQEQIRSLFDLSFL